MARFYVLAKRKNETQWTNWSEVDTVEQCFKQMKLIERFDFDWKISEYHSPLAVKRRKKVFQKYLEWIENNDLYERGEDGMLAFFATQRLIDLNAVNRMLDGAQDDEKNGLKQRRKRLHLKNSDGLDEGESVFYCYEDADYTKRD